MGEGSLSARCSVGATRGGEDQLDQRLTNADHKSLHSERVLGPASIARFARPGRHDDPQGFTFDQDMGTHTSRSF